jgi:uncharacterized circularly permuted ATP-grasp superfamily protein/uncharacterized alpha-E superfamily protein
LPENPLQQSQDLNELSNPAHTELLELIHSLSQIPEIGNHDELRQENGELKDYWVKFFEHLGTDQIKHLAESTKTVDRLIQQNGITYNVYDSDQAQSRPWSLNPLPLVINSREWAEISHGLSQRARLLNEILRDTYGDQSLLDNGFLPTALVQGHPGYLRAAHKIRPPGDIYLHIVAFDIARGPDGKWWVISNRTQAPSGLGYVLENRLIVSKLFPEAFRELRIQHIASSYKRLLDTLTELATPLAQGESVRFALLTPGPYNETYFEHTYLARYLGLPLVEGDDLTVRDDKLYLKTLHGLERIHGLLRRLDDEFMDPLELRADSTLGVPGLLQAIRSGNVLIANALGAGFLESPAIQGFLPAISEKLLGEKLAMPSLHTWWCGEQVAWQNISPELKTQVIKPTFTGSVGPHFQPIVGSQLDEDQLDALREKIEQRPEIYTTQSYLQFSQASTWQENKFTPRTAMLRVYAMANTNGTWEILPGAMTRVSSEDPNVVSIQRGGSTLDTWVMTDGEVDTYSMLSQRSKYINPLTPHGLQLISSRSAENLFWLGRYTERSESLTRLAKESLMIASVSGEENLNTLQDAVSELTIRAGLIPEETPKLSKSPKVFARTLIAQLNHKDSFSIGYYIQALNNNLRLVRDRLPSDHLKLVGYMKSSLENRLDNKTSFESRSLIVAVEALDNLGLQLAALTGLQADRMTRDLGWRLLTIGRLVERLINLSETLGTFFSHDASLSSRGFDMLLTLFDSTITYRTRYQRYQDINALMELLVFDNTNPRSITWILQELDHEIHHLPNTAKEIDTFSQIIQTCQPIFEDTMNIISYSEKVAAAGKTLSNEISSRYFAHIKEQRFAS